MDYIWRHYGPKTQYRIDSSMKASFPLSEIVNVVEDEVFVNPAPRFSAIFRPLLNQKYLQKDNERELQETVNILFHFLAQIDRLCGLSATVLQEEQLDEELSQGFYGNTAQRLYSELNDEIKQKILSLLRYQEMDAGRRLYFREAVKAIFPQAQIYFYHKGRIFLINLPQRENDADRDCMKLISLLFLDVSAKWQIYWEYPFGIIGRKQTMRLNQMAMAN